MTQRSWMYVALTFIGNSRVACSEIRDSSIFPIWLAEISVIETVGAVRQTCRLKIVARSTLAFVTSKPTLGASIRAVIKAIEVVNQPRESHHLASKISA